ncbi:SIS domain-containing protein [bacterium]|nr:SIS domain-containing protein [bacterium]
MENYVKTFLEEVALNLKKVSWKEIAKAMKILQTAYEADGKLFLIGNGGSAAIASHFANDLNKTVFGKKGEKKVKRFQAISLADNIPTLSAWANDVGYEYVFSEQLKNFAQEKDVLIAISSSGNSPNIIKAAQTAKSFHLPIIAFVGFDGGKLISLADAKIHVPSNSYAIVESCHGAICHHIITYFQELLE